MTNILYILFAFLVTFCLIKFFPRMVVITIAGSIALTLIAAMALGTFILINQPKWEAESRRWAENNEMEKQRWIYNSQYHSPANIPAAPMVWNGDHYVHSPTEPQYYTNFRPSLLSPAVSPTPVVPPDASLMPVPNFEKPKQKTSSPKTLYAGK